MAAIPDNPERRSVSQYIRSFLAALPRLGALVAEVQRWDRARFDARKDLDLRVGQVQRQLYAALIPYVQLMTSLRSMRRVMEHHCATYAIAIHACPTAKIALQIEESNDPATYRRVLASTARSHPEDARMAYARALRHEDEGDAAGAAREYGSLADLPQPGAYASMRAAAHAQSADEAERAYRKATELYPNFSLAQRALGGALRARSPLDAAEHYASALSHSPHLEYGEQSWVIAARALVEVELYRGFRVLFSMEEGRNIAFSQLLGMPREGVTARTQGYWRRFLGLALMRFHKDKIWRRVRPAVKSAAVPAADRSAGAGQHRPLLSSLRAPLWFFVSPLRAWVVGHYRYFQFVLVGKDSGDVKGQIDRIHDEWMRDGALEGRGQ